MAEKYITRSEAADYIASLGLRCTCGTLGKMATTGGGPAYRVFGNRACYTVPDLDTWIEAKISPLMCSTSTGVQS